MSVSSQFQGVQHKPSAPKDGLNTTISNASVRAGAPPDETLRVSYGELVEVHEERSTVDILLFGREGDKESKIFEVPLLHPLHFYHMVYGQVRPGLGVRIFWRGGKGSPGREAIAEVFSNEDLSFFRSGKRAYEPNTIATGPWQVFTGGLIG